MLFVKCKVLKSKRGYSRRRLTFKQESHIGYCNCFHMSRANRLSKLRGHNFSMSKKISHESHYRFFRSSTWAKLERDRWKPYFENLDEYREWLKEIDRED